MHADNLTRVLLAAILVCLLFLLGQGWSRGSADDDRAAADSPAAQRFSVRIVSLRRGPPLLLRADTATGQIWRMGLMDEGRWERLREGPDGVPSPGATAPERYFVRAIAQGRGAPTLVREDRLTGRIWRKGSKNKGPWVLVPNPEEALPEAAAAAGEALPDAAAAEEASAP